MIRLSFKNPYLILVFSIIVVVLASVLIPRMPVDILPQFKKSAMQILTLYPGMPAKVVEKDITSRMERWTGQSPGIEKQLSKSIMGVSIVTNFYGEDVEPAEAMANTSSYAMSDMYYQPPGTLPPMVQPFDPTASKPLMLLTVSSEEKSGKELYDIAYYSLRQMLSGVKGIIAPAAYGGALRRIYIFVEPDKLEALGISQTEVNQAIQDNTTMIPSGIAQIGDINYGIDAKGMIIDVKDFNDIVVAYRNGKPIYIKDIGRAEDASAIQTNIARVDGKEQVYLPIFKRPKANTIAAVNEVKNALPKLKERMPDDVQLNVIFDQSSYVRNAISGLQNAGLGGLLLVVLILVIFLGNFRSALIVSLSLPLSVLFAFIVLYFTGEAINSITLGGLALVLGLLVDNSIVVLENIDRQMRMGKNKLDAARDAALEVAQPVLASTLVIIVVFFPVMFLSGMAKFLFSPLAITVAGAMIGSYIFSLTLIPVMASRFLKEQKLEEAQKKEKRGFQRFLQSGQNGYQRLLSKTLKLGWLVLAVIGVLFVGSGFLLSQSGYQLFPESDVGQLEIQVRMESGTPLQATQKTIVKMEEVIRAELGTDLEQLISNLGIFYDLPAAYTPNSGTQDAFIGVQLKENHGVSTFDYASRLRELFHEQFPGIEISFNTGGLITAALNEGKPSPIDIQIKGNKLTVLREIAERVRDTINLIPQTRDVRVLQRLDQPAKDIDLDRIKAAELGVKPVDAIKNIVSALNSSTTYQKAFWIDERNGNHYYVGVTYPESEINNVDVLGNVTVSSQTREGAIPFRNFSKITDSSNPVEINHHNLGRAFNVYANVEGKDIGRVSDEINAMIADMSLPKGYSLAFDGEVNTIQKSFGDLGMGLVLAILFAFLIIVPLFRSFVQPLIIILTVPMGLIGVALLMWVTNTYLSIQSIMGIIMMVGIAVSYGNILIDRINALVKEGLPIQQAIVEGASDRFPSCVDDGCYNDFWFVADGDGDWKRDGGECAFGDCGDWRDFYGDGFDAFCGACFVWDDGEGGVEVMYRINLSNLFKNEKMKIYLYVLLLFFTNILKCQNLEKQYAQISIKMDSMAQKLVKTKKVVGISVGLQVGKSEPFTANYGLANIDRHAYFKESTYFRISTITQAFTAVAIGILIEEGQVKLSDPLSKFFPDFPSGDKVTIYHLLSHTSGIPQWSKAKMIPVTRLPSGWTTQENPHQYIMKMSPLYKFEPGSEYLYSATNYLLLGEIIEDISNNYYEGFLLENIFAPLGMNNSRITGKSENNRQLKNWAVGYHILRNRDESIKKYQSAPDITRILKAIGDMETTVQDMLKWTSGLFNNKLIGADLLEQMTTYSILNSGNPSYESEYPPERFGYFLPKTPNYMQHDGKGYGLGFKIDEINGKKIIWQSGVLPGITALWVYIPDHKATLIVLSNSDKEAVPIFDEILKMICSL